MSIPHVELTDTFDTQRRRLNAAIDVLNGGTAISPGNGLTNAGGVLSVKKTGDGLSFDASGNLVGNDAYANLITQVILNVDDPAPIPTTITSTTIVFPAFSVLFADNAFYGKKISDYTTINVPETTMTLQEGVNGAVYVYVNTAGQILQSLTPISPADSATKCLLGSYFRLSNTIQQDSWKYTPWNGATSKDLRFYEGASLRGGLIQPMATYSLSRTSLTVLKEGVNISTSIYDPNNITYAAENPYTTKELWPGYDPTALDSPTLDTTHVYNMTNNQVEDISSLTGYVVLVPGVVSVTGQDVYLMAMSPKVDGEYTQIFSSMDDATRGVYSLQVSLGNVASRVSWLGQSIIVKIGCTDYTDIQQLRIVGQIPNSLGSSSNYPGAAGGAVVQGLTIKNSGEALLPTDQTSVLDFTNGIVAKGTSETEARISLNTTNCVNYIRSSVDLEIDNNTVTIKSGTIGYIPDGYEHVYSDGENWTELDETTILANTYTWNDIIYDNSKFIAVGNNRTTTTSCGYISTSTDGTTWTTPTQVLDAGTTVWWKLAYNGSMYLAVTSNDKFVSTSTDGTTWTTPTQVSDLPSETIYALYSYGSTFIVLTSNANMFSTTDGITWTNEGQSSTLIQPWMIQAFSVVWDGSKFVAIYRIYDHSYNTNYEYVSTSTDGITWTTPVNITSALGNSPRNYRISYGLGKYIAVDSQGYISTSTDGTTWTTSTRNIIGTFTSAPVYDGNKFLILSTLGYLSYSPNIREGEEYTSVEVQSDVTSISCPADDSYLFVNGSSVGKAVAIDNVYVDELEPSISSEGVWFDLTTNLIKYTNDGGSTWTSGYSLPLAMIHNDGSTVTVKEAFNGHGSISGMAFALPGLAASAPNGYDSNKLLVNRNIMLDHVSVCQVYPYETICLNEDGLISTANIKYSYEQNLNLLNDSPSDYAIIGITNEDTDPRFKNIFSPIDYYDIQEIEAISYHPDLFDCKWSDKILNNPSWVRGDTFSWQSGEMYKAAYKRLVDDFNYSLEHQPKGFSYRESTSGVGNIGVECLAYGAGKFVAISYDAMITTSVDWNTWTTPETNFNMGPQNKWNSVAFDGTKFIAIGQEGWVARSTDGTTWVAGEPQELLNLFLDQGDPVWISIIYDGTKFISLSSSGYVTTTTDGISFTTPVQDSNLMNRNWQSLCYNGSKYVALDYDGYISTSTDGTTWSAAVQNANLGNNMWQSIAWNGNNFLAIGINGYISTSTDGETWTTAIQDNNLGANGWSEVIWHDSSFYAMTHGAQRSKTVPMPSTEEISGITVSYYPAPEGYKICLPDQEANISAIYTATGSAWYYILDAENGYFKLPRKHSSQIVREYNNGTKWYRLYADGWVEQGGFSTTDGANATQINLLVQMSDATYSPLVQGRTASDGYTNATWQIMPVNTTTSTQTTSKWYAQASINGYNLSFEWYVCGQSGIDMSTFQADQKYRYFYMGEFTLPALRNTAGVTTEVLNNKVDRSQLQIVSQLPAQLVDGVIYFVYGS